MIDKAKKLFLVSRSGGSEKSRLNANESWKARFRLFTLSSRSSWAKAPLECWARHRLAQSSRHREACSILRRCESQAEGVEE